MTRKRKRPDTEARRDLLRGLATGIAGTVAVPAVASEAASMRPQEARSGGSGSTSGLLSEPELATLESLSELLVPGSVAAGVPELLDRVAFVETPESQRELLDALRAFEGVARFRHARTWIGLDDDARREILEQAATSKETPVHEHFVSLRDRVAAAFFATEPGMRKLGWTGRSAWRELPVCDPPDDEHR
jgi:hypothetical protein